MTNPILFYSWQSDRPSTNTTDVIRSAADLALSRVARTVRLEDSPRIDSDTTGEPGTPPITETILRKITGSALFLADVTFVSSADAKGGEKPKKLPNPNVMLELGYAAATIGWDRIILVMNTRYGSEHSLPFDLRNRRFPIGFDMGPQTEKPPPVPELAAELEKAIRTHIASEYGRVDDATSRLSSYARQLLVKHAADLQFWESEPDNKILSRLDLAISQLLNAGIIRCVTAATSSGLAYEWTYLGRECCKRLAPTTLPPLPPLLPPPLEPIVDFSVYDSLPTTEFERAGGE